MGAKVSWTDTSVTVTGPPRNSSGRKHLRAIDVNMNKMPDVAMTLAVVALYADGPTAIRDGMFLFNLFLPLGEMLYIYFLGDEKIETELFTGQVEGPFFGPLDLLKFV